MAEVVPTGSVLLSSLCHQERTLFQPGTIADSQDGLNITTDLQYLANKNEWISSIGTPILFLQPFKDIPNAFYKVVSDQQTKKTCSMLNMFRDWACLLRMVPGSEGLFSKQSWNQTFLIEKDDTFLVSSFQGSNLK